MSQEHGSEVAPGVFRIGAKLEDLTPGARVSGAVGAGEVVVVAVQWHGSNALTLTYKDGVGRLGESILYREREPSLTIAQAASMQAFDGDPAAFRLAAEALRIRMAARFDPMLAVSTSDMEALPHQIKAVYGELLPRTPLRFLLADDPGAGKTIMAGLYIKELMLRGDLARCLIVAPGSLVEQWQEELLEKFGMRFELLTRSMIDATIDGSVFDRNPLLIARMDQLSRSEELAAQLERSDWDLVVIDEAHRMSAHYFGQELKKTRRYQLGELLGRVARHLLLMTATPHAGKEEDFQLFLALLDSDRFEGRFRDGVHAVDTDGLMRRMVKEELLTFEGKPLFPERRASTVPYQLSDAERELYEAVTLYVREEMNRADQLKADGEGRRSNTVGFALTVLQRRLASSPEAIWRSLERRRRRLQARRQQMLTEGDGNSSVLEERLAKLLGRTPTATEDALNDDLDDLTSEEREAIEDDVVDAASAARTVAELETEIAMLTDLEELARQVRNSGTDKKWTELRSLLLDHEATRDEAGNLRKIIIFTEHRDTLTYLVAQIRAIIGRDEAVVAIHGGVRREERRKVQELFTQDKDVLVLVATDAAGEGLNLQRAHLMVNYDLPWNPNRIEQRFGRIHRIGQTEVCHLWNLLAADTREGAVFERLLDKIEEQRRAYNGKIFDVLGEAFEGTPLRSLLLDAIRYGDQPDVRARLDEVIDASVGEGLDKLIAERALHHDVLVDTEVTEIRLRLEEARARRLQPHYIKAFFNEAFPRLGGRIAEREAGRFEITNVPGDVRDRDRQIGVGAPVLRRYERVTFERDLVRVQGQPKADLLAPGHPLLDAVVDLTIERHAATLKHGTVLIDSQDPGETARVLVAVTQEITDGHEPARTVSKRFDFVEIAADGLARQAGPAPYLDYDPPTPEAKTLTEKLIKEPWLASGIDRLAMNWAIEHGAHEHMRAVEARVVPDVARARQQVKQRLTQEINYWDARHAELLDAEAAGRQLRIRPETAAKRARDLEHRLERRLAQLNGDERLLAKPPHVAGGALVLPQGMLDRAVGGRDAPVSTYAKQTEEVERRAVDAVLAAERALGRIPREMPHNNPGFDVLSLDVDEHPIFIEVKGRILGAEDVTVTRNEVLVAKNNAAKHRLALVVVHPDGSHLDELRYLVDPFAADADPSFEVTKIVYVWRRLWDRGGPPC
ncbi:MAG: helicase-related protein [Mycobacteriales bacterium]